MRRIAAVVGLSVTAVALATATASAQTAVPPTPAPNPIAPKQFFGGLVNGSAFNASIRVACGVAVTPTKFGRAVPGQTVSVSRAVVASTASAMGFTGAADSVAAYLDAPSPLASPVRAPIAKFAFYNRPAAIPSDIPLPCSGTGRMSFEPIDGGTTARAAVVVVQFVRVS
jgi:hypothetical protein